MKKIIDLIISYKFFLPIVIFYEFIFVLLGYRGNNIIIRNNEICTDTIPCPYYFLCKIHKNIKSYKIKSFTDIGCGDGRVIDFFSKKTPIKLIGYELFKDSFISCKNKFKNNKNISIYNSNFFNSFDKLALSDCYFINDPVKDTNLHNDLFSNFLKTFTSLNPVYFILVNVSTDKRQIFNNLDLLIEYRVGTRGFYIYKYN